METSDNNEGPQPPPPSLFAAAVFKVSVAQICRTVGFRGAQPSALRSLSDVAARYLQALARSASTAANSEGRTDSNLSDVVIAIEDLSSPRGFAGAYDVSRPTTRSGVLKEIVDFVESVEEIPFPRPILREERFASLRVSPASFAESKMDRSQSHVPRWLPVFPHSWETRERGEEIGGGGTGGGGYGGRTEDRGVQKRAVLPSKRARVKFNFTERSFNGKKQKALLLDLPEKRRHMIEIFYQ